MKKVAISTCYGGFSLSDKAEFLYLKKKNPGKNIELKEDRYGNSGAYVDGEYQFVDYWKEGFREDPCLIEVIEEMEEKANGMYSKLKIVEIPDDVKYTIEEYDGVESIHEVHRIWE